MEISPIPGIRIAPVIRSAVTDLGLTDVYEVERSSRTGDETYTPSGAKAATGFEEDEDDNGYDDANEDASAEPDANPSAKGSIDFLA